MADEYIDLSALPTEVPAVTLPSNWEYSEGSDNGKIINGVGFSPLSGGEGSDGGLAGWSCSSFSEPDENGDLVGTLVIDLGADATSNSTFVTLQNAAGDGYAVKKEAYSIKLYAITAGSINGSLTQLASAGTSPSASDDTLSIKYNPSTGSLRSYYNGALISTVTNTAYDADPLRAGFAVDGYSGFIRIRAFTAFNIAASAAIALPDDITILTEYEDNAATGFADGAATLSYGGVDVAVTVASELFDFTLPMIQHDVVSPRLPAVSAEFTLTQGLISATDNANIFLPTGFDTTRVGDLPGGDPANFAGIVDDDPTYLGYAFAQASNDLTTSDSAVFVTSDGYWVGRDTFVQSNEFEIDGITPVLPRTDDLYVWRASTGKYYEHSITLTDAGAVIVDGGGLSVRGLSVRGLSVVGLSVRGLGGAAAMVGGFPYILPFVLS